MPQIQVLGREALEEKQGNQSAALEREKMVQSAIEKGVQFKQMAEELKIKAKTQESDAEKNRLLGLATRLDYLSKTYDIAAKYTDPEAVIGQMLKISGDETMKTLADPDVRGMTGRLMPVGQEWKQTLSDIARKKSGLPPIVRGGQPGSNIEAGAQGPVNQPQINATNGVTPQNAQQENYGAYGPFPGYGGMGDGGMGGSVGGMVGNNEPVMTDMDENGATLNFPDELMRKNYYSGLGSEMSKPYSLEESKVISARNTIVPAIQKLNDAVNAGLLDGYGAQTFVDFGNPTAAYIAGTPEATRDALGYMNELKNLIPFARGGKQLTPYEAKLVFRLLNTQGKTREQIKRDLKVYTDEFNTMVQLISRARGSLSTKDLEGNTLYNFGGGKDYDTLVGGNKGNPKQTKIVDGIEVNLY